MNMGAFPSGQWGQTVNLLLNASVVRIHQLPPKESWQVYCRDFFCFSTVKANRASCILQCCPDRVLFPCALAICGGSGYNSLVIAPLHDTQKIEYQSQ